MKLLINGKKYKVHFGVKFIREMDKNNFLEKDGAKFGAGLELRAGALYDYSTPALAEILYTGTCTEKNRPSISEVDRFIEEHEDLEGLFEEVISELKKGNATRLKMEKLESGIRGQDAPQQEAEDPEDNLEEESTEDPEDIL